MSEIHVSQINVLFDILRYPDSDTASFDMVVVRYQVRLAEAEYTALQAKLDAAVGLLVSTLRYLDAPIAFTESGEIDETEYKALDAALRKYLQEQP